MPADPESQALIEEETNDSPAMPIKHTRPLNIVKAMAIYVFSSAFWQKYIRFIFEIFYRDICLGCLLIFIIFYLGYGGLCSVLMLFVCLISILRCVEHNLVFHCDEPVGSRCFVERPNSYNLPYENVKIASGRHFLHAYFFLRKKPLRSQIPTFIQFHGNAGNIGHRLTYNKELFTTCQVNILSVDYRGFGKSTGSTSEYNLYEDARSSLKFVLNRSDIDPNNIFLLGQSIGGAVSIDLAADPIYGSKIKAMVLENTFTSLPSVGRALFNIPVVRSVPDWLLMYQFQSLSKLRKIDIPILFLSGLHDTLVPPMMMRQLYEASLNPYSKLVLFLNGGHNDTWNISGYFEAISDFLNKVKDFQVRGDVMNV